jgi:16S rRNA (guanine966-N2)-methyltransferase
MKNNIRITGGSLKGKKIPFDFKSSLRPTSSKLREVLFNWLQFEMEDCQCLDLFAGTGALGIEAISRGAQKTVFIELNKKNYLELKKSISELNLKNQSMLLFKDGLSWIKKNDLSNFDLILLDPPFNQDYEKKVLEVINKNQNLKSSCKIYIEFSKFTNIDIPNSFKICKEKTIGDVKALLLENDNQDSL